MGCDLSLTVLLSSVFFEQGPRAWQRDNSSFTLSEKIMGAYFLQGCKKIVLGSFELVIVVIYREQKKGTINDEMAEQMFSTKQNILRHNIELSGT